MPVKCRDIISIIDNMAPPYLASKWDNVGLLVGDEDALISSVLVTLDVNNNVIDEAIEQGINLIITHHPFIFSPIKSVNVKNFKERMIHKIISNNINIFSAHTNLDAAQYGINDFLAQKLGLSNVSVLEKTYENKMYKIAVFVPRGYEDIVCEAMTNAGGGHIGNYSRCTFNTKGTGTFMPLDGSKPFIGKIGAVEHVNEVKIETIADSNRVWGIVEAMLKVHPYEEAAYDVYPLVNNAIVFGFGRTGYLASSMSLKELCSKVKSILNIEYVNAVGMLDREIKKVAVCSGSGADFIYRAYTSGCDVYITGDIKYHDACDARDMGIALIDAGHFASENIFMGQLYDYLKEQMNMSGFDTNIALSSKNTNPFIKV